MRFPEYLAKHLPKDCKPAQISETVFRLKKDKKIPVNQKKLLIISGLSGAGKDSVLNGLVSDERFGLIKTCTTRSKRPEEETNDPYVHISIEQFNEALNRKDVIEWVNYAGNYYCSLSSIFEESFSNFEFPILRIDPKGSTFYVNCKTGVMENVEVVYIFVAPPSMIALRKRLLLRSGDPQFVQKRIDQAEIDLPYLKEADFVVINKTGKLDQVVEEIKRVALQPNPS